MTKTQSYLQRYHEVMYGEAWYGDYIFKKLNSLSPTIVFQSPKKGIKSIAELLWHIIAWRKYIIEKLKGNAEYKIDLNSDKDWARTLNPSSETWQQLLQELENTQSQIEYLLSEKEDTFLQSIVPGIDYTFEFILEGIIQHDIYHVGQIVLLAKFLEE